MPMFADSVRATASALMVVALIVAALVLGRDVLIPFALAAIVAFVLAPIVRFLTGIRIPRGAAVSFVIITLVAILITISAVFSAQLLSLTASLASYKDNLGQKVRMVTGARSGDNALRKAAESVDQLEKEFKREPSPGISPGPSLGTPPSVVVSHGNTSMFGSLFEQLRGVLGPLATTALTLLFAGFLLLQYHDIRDRIVRLVGTDNMTATTSALSEAGTKLSHLFLMQAALNAGFGTFVCIALAIIGVPNPLLWGVATFFLRFVPFIGSFLSAIPPILLAAAVDPGWSMAIATLALFVIGEPLVGHVIEPVVLGKGVGLTPFAMVVAASFWTLVWGPIGLILAAPLTMSIVILGRYIPRLEFMSVLLGDTPALAPEQEFYHRLLSDDQAAAVEQLEQAIAITSVGAAADDIVLPALRIAARDHRIDRLEVAQTNALRDTMSSVVELVVAEFDDRADSEHGNQKSSDRDQILVVPARGPIDSIAAGFVAAILETTVDRKCAAVEHASGLMALSAAHVLADDGQVGSVVLSTVGGLDHQHLRLLVKRAEREFPHARLLICDWGSEQENKSGSTEPMSSRRATVAKLTTIIEMLAYDNGRKAADGVPSVVAAPVGVGRLRGV